MIFQFTSRAFFATLLLLFVLCVNAPGAETKPNIIYILADDMGYADTGFNGCTDLRTPNIDRLARGGTVLKSFYVQPVCSPTRAALMTGRYAVHTGVYGLVGPKAQWGLGLHERTLADALREAGYETAIVGKWHLGRVQPEYLPTKRGFDHQYGFFVGQIDYFTHIRLDEPDWWRDDKPIKEEGYSTHLFAKEACRVIREKKPDKPLFLYLAFNAVHAPHQAPDEYLKPYDKLTGTRKIYAGMVAAMDEAIGQVLAALDEKGIRTNTLIVFSSDNGGPQPGVVTSNYPLRAGKATLYEGGVRVCACVNWPGQVPANSVVNEPLHAVDWFPTLVKLAGGSLKQTNSLDGLDIWPLLTRGEKLSRESILICDTRPARAALRVGDWKLVRGGNRPDEIYNLASDLGEKNDLASSQPEKLKELQAKLDAAMKNAVPPRGPSRGEEEKAKDNE